MLNGQFCVSKTNHCSMFSDGVKENNSMDLMYSYCWKKLLVVITGKFSIPEAMSWIALIIKILVTSFILKRSITYNKLVFSLECVLGSQFLGVVHSLFLMILIVAQLSDLQKPWRFCYLVKHFPVANLKIGSWGRNLEGNKMQYTPLEVEQNGS